MLDATAHSWPRRNRKPVMRTAEAPRCLQGMKVAFLPGDLTRSLREIAGSPAGVARECEEDHEFDS